MNSTVSTVSKRNEVMAACATSAGDPLAVGVVLGPGGVFPGGRAVSLRVESLKTEDGEMKRHGNTSTKTDGRHIEGRRTDFAAKDCVAALALSVLLPLFLLTGCQDGPAPLTAEVPLHLEDHLDAAVITGSEVPSDVPAAVEWRFDEPQPDWKPLVPLVRSVKPARVKRTKDSLRITLTKETDYKEWDGRPKLSGGVYVNLPDWRREEWGEILIRARTAEKIEGVGIGFNLREKIGSEPWERWPVLFFSPGGPVIRDGTEQTYVMRADWSVNYRGQHWKGPWRQLVVSFWSREPASIDVLSVSVVPKEARFADAPLGVKTEARGELYRRTLYTHGPSKIQYRVRVPEAGRLDVNLGVLRDDFPVTFRVTAQTDGQALEHLFEETYSDEKHWGRRSVDLAHLARKEVALTLETEAERSGTVALWAAPTLSGARATKKPNVIFYIIDGAGADYMSVYGYNRRTTPNMERLAAEGAVFEHAYSNSSWTRPSTLSFLTGLHHSSMGGMKNNRNAPPDEVLTIQEHLHHAGYQTALFTSNPNAATMSGLDRGVDVLRENGVEPTSRSTEELHADFWKWRNEYPSEPYWVHFQTTDVHGPDNPPAPFAGLYVNPERRKLLKEWERKLMGPENRWFGGPWSDRFEKTGVDRFAFYNAKRNLYAETMAHQDYQIGRLVERLKAKGEWENTLLIIAADHGADAGSQDYAVATLETLPPIWHPMLRPGITRIPMIFVWPDRIKGGRRFRDPVSMIDMLPTILDLVGLRQPEVKQGQSLAPLLLGKPGWEPRPVILDEFYEDANTGKMLGRIEVIDGRWGASLEINQDPENDERPPERKRPVPLVLYDLWNDPHCLKSVHEEHPELVRKYTEFLEAQFEANRSLAQRFTRGEDAPLTPE